MARFIKSRLYTVKGKYQGLSGFRRVDPWESVIFGSHIRSRVDIDDRATAAMFTPDRRQYRIDEGHLPDHQPIVSGVDLKDTMIALGAIQAFVVT